MALIKNIRPVKNLQGVLPPKISVKEKWEQLAGKVSRELNRMTHHWKRRQQKCFLITFCTGFIGLLFLSFCFLTNQHYEGKPVTVPPIPQKLLLPEKQVLKTLRPPEPEKILPPLVDSGKYQQQ